MRKSAVLAALALGACTQAQMQYKADKNLVETMAPRINSCFQQVEATPAGRIVTNLLVQDDDRQAVAKMSINRNATTDEQRALLQFSTAVQPCRDMVLQTFGQIDAGMFNAQVKFYGNLDLAYVDIISTNVTVGSGNKFIYAARNAAQREVSSAEAAYLARLETSHNAEMVARQQALAAYQSYQAQQQAAQTIANAMNRPVSTVCTDYGTQIRCTTQ